MTPNPARETCDPDPPADPDARAYHLLTMRDRARELMYRILTSDVDSERAELLAAYERLRQRIERVRQGLDRAD